MVKLRNAKPDRSQTFMKRRDQGRSSMAMHMLPSVNNILLVIKWDGGG